MLDLRVRSRLDPDELAAKAGKILGPADYDCLLTGAARVSKLDGKPLCVYLPGAVTAQMDDPAVHPVFRRLLKEQTWTDNRGLASGTPRQPTRQSRSRTRKVPSMVAGALDAAGQQKYCRLTAWTGRNLPAWQTLHPLLEAVAAELAQHVPERYAAQARAALDTHPAWVVPGTPFTTITVNNTYPTGVHTDKGDLDSGFSTIACLRRGRYSGGNLVFPEYRIAVDLHHGDLLLMDAHEWHGNVQLTCACGKPAMGPCQQCGAERVSVVSYFRTRLTDCGSPDAERERGDRWHERVAGSKLQNRPPAGDTPARHSGL